MSMTRQSIIASRPAAMVLALSLVAGLSAPVVMLPNAYAAAGAPLVPAGVVELSAAPVEQTKAVPPNIAVTFDDSGSMAWDYLGDDRPFDNKSWNWGPWYCAGVIDPAAKTGTIGAHVMNGVYYNPKVNYVPPINANGTAFPQADATLAAVWNDGIKANRPLNPGGVNAVTSFNNQTTTVGSGSNTQTVPTYWECPYDSRKAYDLGSSGNQYSTTAPVPGGGPYYYQLKPGALTTLEGQLDQYGNPTSAGRNTLYTASNWEAVAVPVAQYQNWANWWAYYHTRNQMARTALSRVFGSTNLATMDDDGNYGSPIRVVWQNINTAAFKLPSNAIISALIDTANCTSGNSANPETTQRSGTSTTPPDCYRSAFFNWIFQIPASGGTPLRSAFKRAGDFFERGKNNTGANGNLEDPYWQPPQQGAFNSSTNPGNELYCRQNFSLVITDGLWNTNRDGGTVASLTAQPTAGATLPDGVTFPNPATAGVTSIYAPQHDADNPGYVSLSDLAYNYWATNLRTDLYKPDNGEIVTPYLPDVYAKLFAGVGNVSFRIGTNADGSADDTTIPAEEYFNPKNDPATWPHMSSYMVGLGVNGVLNFSENTDCKSDAGIAVDQDACALREGKTNSAGIVGWTQPRSNGTTGVPENIDDTWHAALAGRGQFFSAGNPQDLVDQLSSILSSIAARAATPAPAAANVSVATVGALTFNVGHNKDWSGVFQAMVLNPDGSIGGKAWDAGEQLDERAASSRDIYTDSYKGGTFSSFAFTAGNDGAMDPTEQAGLETPPLPTDANGDLIEGSTDTLEHRIDYLRGDQTYEADGTYRKRVHTLGAIIHAQPVYVSYPGGGYNNNWPSGSPETDAAAASNGTDDKSYGSFVMDHKDRPGTVYVGANDGMLHAFAAPAPTGCAADGTGCKYGDGGKELWAFVPRAVYANLGNLTDVTNFQYRPTVDATPVTRDVFFAEGDKKWHTILVGGVGVGGRGVYALDITDPTSFSASNVLWEFDSDMTVSSDCVASYGTCRATDLGYTVPQPNIGRLHNGAWAVLVPNGYFPDCSKSDIPTADKASCQAVADQAPKDGTGPDAKPYSALFVLDAETGKVIAELKTPTDIAGVTSFGLATPVIGDYQNDQVDDVAFAGDLQGNLWRFDLSKADPAEWKVTLVYKGFADDSGKQGLQPITSMPRLFPDPATNRFMVVFGTGKYLGTADNGDDAMQAVYGVRDVAGTTYSQSDLTRDYLHETPAPATLPDGTPNPNAGATLRCVTGNASDTCTSPTASPVNSVPAPDKPGGGGWRIDLNTTTSGGVQNDKGERVVVNPGAIFASNTVVFETLLTGSQGSDPCNPSTQGAIMALNATTGGPAGVSSLGGGNIVGGRISNARTSGSLPVVSALGGGRAYLPGVSLAPAGKGPVAIDAPIWRRRSWSEIQQNQ